MRNPIIGIILKGLLKEYEQGFCDNLSSEEEEIMLQELKDIKDKLSDTQDKVLTTEEASIYLGVTRQTLNNYVKEGKLHPKKHLGGVMEFKLRELKLFIKNSRLNNNK